MRLIPLIPLVLIAACSREDIRVYRVPKEKPIQNASLPVESPSKGLHWDAPPAWKEKPASGMRAASFEAAGAVDISITLFPGDAGGELANVNRWRSQVGLPSWSAGELESNSRRLKSRVGPVLFIEFSKDQAILAGILQQGGNSWFFKAMGAEAAVKAAKPDFIAFLENIHAAH